MDFFIQIALSCLETSAEMLFVSFAGVYLFHIGVLRGNKSRVISSCVLEILLPCLTLSSLPPVVSLSLIRDCWTIPAFIIYQFSVGFLLSHAEYYIFKTFFFLKGLPSDYQNSVRRFTMAVTLFTNTNALPIPLLTSIVAMSPWLIVSVGKPTREMVDNATDRAIGYLLMYNIFMSTCLWGVGSKLLAKPPRGNRKPGEFVEPEDQPWSSRLWKRIQKIRRLFTPPFVASLTALFIGLVTPVRDVFFGDDAPLLFVSKAVKAVGRSAVPCLMIVLGASIANCWYSMKEEKEKKEHKDIHALEEGNELDKMENNSKDLVVKSVSHAEIQRGKTPMKEIDENSGEEIPLIDKLKEYSAEHSPPMALPPKVIPKSYLITMVAVILVIKPLLTAVPLWFLWKSAPQIFPEDDFYVLALMIVASTPSAINFIVICQNQSHFINDISLLIFYEYLSAIVTLTLFCASYLALLRSVS